MEGHMAAPGEPGLPTESPLGSCWFARMEADCLIIHSAGTCSECICIPAGRRTIRDTRCKMADCAADTVGLSPGRSALLRTENSVPLVSHYKPSTRTRVHGRCHS